MNIFILILLGLVLIFFWREHKKAQDKMMAMIFFRDEWAILKTLKATGDFKIALEEDEKLPDKFKFPWVRMYYDLIKDEEEFINDITDDYSAFPEIDYDELAKVNKLEWKKFKKGLKNDNE